MKVYAGNMRVLCAKQRQSRSLTSLASGAKARVAATPSSTGFSVDLERTESTGRSAWCSACVRNCLPVHADLVHATYSAVATQSMLSYIKNAPGTGTTVPS